MADDEVTSLAQDGQGRIWVGTMAGVGVVEEQAVLGVRLPAEGEADVRPIVLTLAVDGDGTVWAGGKQGGLWRCLRPEEIERVDGVDPKQTVESLAAAAGTLWVGCSLGSVGRVEADRYDEVAGGLGAVRRLCLGGDGTVWVASYARTPALCRMVGDVATPVVADELRWVRLIDALLAGPDGAIWLGTGTGLIRYEPETGTAYRYTTADGLPANAITALARDADYRLWVGTSGGGVARYEDGSFLVLRLGLPGRWSPASPDTEVVLPDLDAGTYRFEVRAVDFDGLVSDPAWLSVDVALRERERVRPAPEVVVGLRRVPLLGTSRAIRQLFKEVEGASRTQVTVQLYGETGTGKELVARLIHQQGPRKDGPFIAVNCGAIPPGLVQSQIFGHEEGSFTGAIARQAGCFEQADGGTLFLDEVSDLPLSAQRSLLRVLEGGELWRIGAKDVVRVDVRVVAATNRSLEEEVRAKRFREDLWFRLGGFAIRLLPLRERREDIQALAHHFAALACAGGPLAVVSAEALATMEAYDWPGNVRELAHVMERAVAVCRDEVIRVQDLDLRGQRPDGVTGQRHGPAPVLSTTRDSLAALESQAIREALEHSGGVVFGQKGRPVGCPRGRQPLLPAGST